jgi:hypothetical protein
MADSPRLRSLRVVSLVHAGSPFDSGSGRSKSSVSFFGRDSKFVAGFKVRTHLGPTPFSRSVEPKSKDKERRIDINIQLAAYDISESTST